MNLLVQAIETAQPAVLRQIIDRFVEAAQKRSESQPTPRRRQHRRYHRSWPLAIIYHADDGIGEMGAALHNASGDGLAFLSPRSFDGEELVYLRLFWHDEDSPLVPAVVRHCTPTKSGYLIGCEFLLQGL